MHNKELDVYVRRAKKHDPDAFTYLCEINKQGMYKVARSILHNDEDAADAIQETILKCWEKIETLKVNKYFKTWLTRILINNCYRIRNERPNVMPLEDAFEMPVYSEESDFEWKEVLSVLNESYRPVVTLFYAQGFTTKEISKILGIPHNTVRTKLARARKALENYLKEQGQ